MNRIFGLILVALLTLPGCVVVAHPTSRPHHHRCWNCDLPWCYHCRRYHCLYLGHYADHCH